MMMRAVLMSPTSLASLRMSILSSASTFPSMVPRTIISRHLIPAPARGRALPEKPSALTLGIILAAESSTIRDMATPRRDVLRALAAAPLALQAKDPAPNILFILSDDHSYPYLGAYGATWMSTP